MPSDNKLTAAPVARDGCRHFYHFGCLLRQSPFREACSCLLESFDGLLEGVEVILGHQILDIGDGVVEDEGTAHLQKGGCSSTAGMCLSTSALSSGTSRTSLTVMVSKEYFAMIVSSLL